MSWCGPALRSAPPPHSCSQQGAAASPHAQATLHGAATPLREPCYALKPTPRGRPPSMQASGGSSSMSRLPVVGRKGSESSSPMSRVLTGQEASFPAVEGTVASLAVLGSDVHHLQIASASAKRCHSSLVPGAASRTPGPLRVPVRCIHRGRGTPGMNMILPQVFWWGVGGWGRLRTIEMTK